MDGFENINAGPAAQQSVLAWALRYAAHSLNIFPVRSNKRPLVAHWRADATSDRAAIEAWLERWPHCDFGWALSPGVVVVDIDIKHVKNGYTDFERLDGCDPRDILTPSASTPSGGLQLFYKAAKAYKNAVAIGGTGIDTRTEGGYVVLPGPGNGRKWLRELIGAPLLPAPAWLDCALRREQAPLTLAQRAAVVPPSSDPWAQRKALAELEKACARIRAAPCGAQDGMRHAQCFYIGGLIKRGDLDYATAYTALLEAALAMPAHRDPWRNLDVRVARSIEAGIGHPLAISETEAWLREFRARMRLERPVTFTGARNG